MRCFAVHLALVLSLQTSLAAQDVFYIDATHGQDDAAMSGDISQPFQSLTYATTRATPGHSLTVYCQPGVYTQDTTPIQVGLDALSVLALTAGSVDFRDLSFSCYPQSGDLSLIGLTVYSADDFLSIAGASQGHALHVVLDNMLVYANRVISSSVSNDSYVNIDARLSHFEATQEIISMTSRDTSHIKLNMQRCYLQSKVGPSGTPAFYGIYARAMNSTATLDVNIENSIFREFYKDAIYLKSSDGPVNVMCQNNNFVGNGLGAGSAINLQRTSSTSSYPFANLFRNIFYLNSSDIRNHANMPYNFFFDTNLVEDPTLVGQGGNLSGSPDFVGQTFVLGPGSAARGAAPLGGLAEDFYGNLRDADGSADLGPFEMQAWSFGTTHGRAFLNSNLNMAVSGPPKSPFALYAGWVYTPGTGLQIQPASFGNPGLIAQTNAAGEWTLGYPVPNAPGLTGQTLYFQLRGLLPSGGTTWSQVIPVVPVYPY